MKLVWTSQAAARLRSIFAHVAEQDQRAANRLVTRIEFAVELLTRHPGLGRPGVKAGTRELVISGTSYIAVYAVTGSEIRLITIFHSRQNWPTRS